MTPTTPTLKSTINRSEPVNLGPKQGPPYPKDVSPSSVWSFTASNTSEMALHVLAYNMKRVMQILGVGGLMAAMRA
jgi:hypothetical protein